MTLYVEAGIDVEALGGPISVALTEGATPRGTASIAQGTFFLRTDGATITAPDREGSVPLGYGRLTTALQAALNALPGIANTYAVGFDPATQRITISRATGSTAFSLSSFSAAAQKALGYTANTGSGASHVANRAPWYWIKTAQGILSEYFWDEDEDGDLGDDERAHDGTAFAIAEDEVATLYEATIPLEPRAIVWNEFAEAAVPFTWQRLFRHARNVQPLVIDFQDGSITRKFFVRLRRDGRLFKPVPRQTRNWWEYADIELRARLLGVS